MCKITLNFRWTYSGVSSLGLDPMVTPSPGQETKVASCLLNFRVGMDSIQLSKRLSNTYYGNTRVAYKLS